MVDMTQQHRARAEVVPPVTLGWRLQLAIGYAGLSHADLMSKFEVSRKTVSRWCNDVGPAPKKFILNEIAVMCGVSPRWLIDGTVPRSNHPLDAPSSPRRGDGEDDTTDEGETQLPRLDSNQEPFDHRSVA